VFFEMPFESEKIHECLFLCIEFDDDIYV
jgi:hypothetical protein